VTGAEPCRDLADCESVWGNDGDLDRRVLIDDRLHFTGTVTPFKVKPGGYRVSHASLTGRVMGIEGSTGTCATAVCDSWKYRQRLLT
jgi:hypothetical protein